MMMIPLVVLLLLAVWKRVGNYGITESRYILIILAVWLTLVTVYFLISKKQNIKIIPVSLCLLALLATYGPQSAFSVSKYSQVARLKRLIASNNKKDIDQRADVVDYLVDRHGLSTLQPFTKVNLEELEVKIEARDTTQSRYAIKSKKTDTAYALLKIKRIGRRYTDNVRFVPLDEVIVNVKGYDYVIPIENYPNESTSVINNQPVVVERVRPTGNLKVKIGAGVPAEFDLHKLAGDAVKAFKSGKLKERPNGGNAYYLSQDSLTLTQNLNNYELKLVIISLDTSSDTEDPEELNRQLSYNGYLLIRVK